GKRPAHGVRSDRVNRPADTHPDFPAMYGYLCRCRNPKTDLITSDFEDGDGHLTRWHNDLFPGFSGQDQHGLRTPFSVAFPRSATKRTMAMPIGLMQRRCRRVQRGDFWRFSPY